MAEYVLDIVEGTEAGRQVPLNGPTEIGSGSGAGIRLGDEHVVERHARVTASGEQVTVEDLGGPYGTYVNEHPIHGPHPLRTGDRLRAGVAVLELRTADQAAAQARTAAGPAVTEVGSDVLAPVDPGELPPATEHAPNVASFLTEETEAAFLPPDAVEGPREDRYGALSSWTDTRVKHQTHVAAFGLLGAAAIALLVIFV